MASKDIPEDQDLEGVDPDDPAFALSDEEEAGPENLNADEEFWNRVDQLDFSSATTAQHTAIVIDSGSGSIKAGFNDEQRPSVCIPSLVGYPRKAWDNAKRRYIGIEAQENRGLLSLKYPIEQGIISDWDEIEELWSNVFTRLSVDPRDRPVLMAEPPLNPRRNKERTAEVMFEKFGIPALHVNMQAVLSLYSSGRDSGIALDSGDGVTHVVPVYDGYAISSAIQRLNFAGRDLTEYLGGMLVERGYPLTKASDRLIVEQLKEKHSFVSFSYAEDMKKMDNDPSLRREEDVKLTRASKDAQTDLKVKLDRERFRAPEALFQPILLGLEEAGIHKMCCDTIVKSPIDIRRTLAKNVVISGGSMVIPGMVERLTWELTTLLKHNLKVRVIAEPFRRHGVWVGGSLLAGVLQDEQWIYRDEWEEEGAPLVHQKSISAVEDR